MSASLTNSGKRGGCALHGFNGILGVVDSSSSCTIINQMQRWHSLITGGHQSPCGFSERRTFVNNNTSALLNICDAPLSGAHHYYTVLGGRAAAQVARPVVHYYDSLSLSSPAQERKGKEEESLGWEGLSAGVLPHPPLPRPCCCGAASPPSRNQPCGSSGRFGKRGG